MELTINLPSITKVEEFCAIVSEYDCEVTVKSEDYEIDAKSTLGIFRLNILKPLTVCLYSNDGAMIDRFIKDMGRFREEV